MEKEIIKKLSISNSIELIGSNSIGKLKYTTDFDLQEYISIHKLKDYQKYVRKIQQVFKSFQKSKTVFITDFKSGYHNTQPVRWNYTDIINGYKIIDNDIIINLFDTLQLKSNKIKIDIIAFINDKFVEFSCNYYFHSSDVDVTDIYKSLLLDVKKYYHAKKFMKMLKRLLSYRMIRNESVDDIIVFLNSQAGFLYQLQHQLDIILFVIEENVDVNAKYINQSVNKLLHIIPAKYKKGINKKAKWIDVLNKIKNVLHDDINLIVISFLE
jgi:hypothetical protein